MSRGSSEDAGPSAERRVRRGMSIRGLADLKIESRHVTAEAVDISEHGVCLTLAQPVEVGTRYQLNLAVDTEVERRISVVARVCFCLRTKHGFRVGLNCSLAEFMDEGL